MRTLQLEIQPPLRGRVIALLGAIGVNCVITARIDDAAETGFIFLLVGIVSERQQPFAGDTALGVKRDAAIDIDVILLVDERFEAVIELVKADCASSKADNRPRAITGIKPCFDTLRALDLAVLKVKSDADRARSRRWFQFDIGYAVIALNPPYWRCTFQPRKLRSLLCIDLNSSAMGIGDGEITYGIMLDRFAVAICEPYGNARARNAISTQHGEFLDKLRLHRADWQNRHYA